MIVWDPIAPTEILISAINWAPRLGTDTISTSTWSAVTPAGPTSINPSISADKHMTFITIGNCTIDVIYKITNTVITASGQTEVETAQFICAPK